jgi:hypothetical protein
MTRRINRAMARMMMMYRMMSRSIVFVALPALGADVVMQRMGMRRSGGTRLASAMHFSLGTAGTLRAECIDQPRRLSHKRMREHGVVSIIWHTTIREAYSSTNGICLGR